MELENNVFFWQKLDTLVLAAELKIDRPKNSTHPKYANLVYPVDYGYFEDTKANDQEPIDVFVGSGSKAKVQAIVVSADILKKDVEVKILLGCNTDEELNILHFLNQTDFQKAIIVRRGNEIPSWNFDEN